jgi:hypothetical protein
MKGKAMFASARPGHHAGYNCPSVDRTVLPRAVREWLNHRAVWPSSLA